MLSHQKISIYAVIIVQYITLTCTLGKHVLLLIRTRTDSIYNIELKYNYLLVYFLIKIPIFYPNKENDRSDI